MKIALSMLCLLSLLFGTGGSLLIAMAFHDSLERERQSVYTSYQSVLGILQVLNTLGQQTDYEDIRQALEQLPAQSTVSWDSLRLYDEDQTIFEDGIIFLTGEYSHRGDCCVICFSSGQDKPMLLTGSGSLTVGEKTLYLDIGRDVSALFDTRNTEIRSYRYVFLVLIILCAVFSYSLAWLLTRPLSELSRASRIISGGDLSRRARIQSKDEIGRVARDFNAMADTLEANIHELEASVERQKRFTGSFAHEVKTPMTSIIGYADLMRSGVLDAEEQREAANFIVAEGKRMERLSRKLLELQLLQSEGVLLFPAKPSLLIEELAAQWQGVYSKEGIRFSCHTEPGECLLEPELVKTLLLNLFDNARKAMKGKGGWVVVECAMLTDGCRITVTDSGAGIPSQSLEHLTEAFYRVDKSRSRALGGSGLGLALCKEIAVLHNGSLHFESEVGHGTRVTVVLRGGIR